MKLIKSRAYNILLWSQLQMAQQECVARTQAKRAVYNPIDGMVRLPQANDIGLVSSVNQSVFLQLWPIREKCAYLGTLITLELQ